MGLDEIHDCREYAARIWCEKYAPQLTIDPEITETLTEIIVKGTTLENQETPHA